MIRIPAKIRRTFSLALAPEAALALMRDVPSWGMLFPNVDSIKPLADDVWRWDMTPMGPPGLEVRTVYACHYAFDEATHTASWTPEAGIGNAEFSGSVSFTPEASGGSNGQLWLDATLEIPAPRLLRGIVRPALGFEFRRMTGRFLSRLVASVEEL